MNLKVKYVSVLILYSALVLGFTGCVATPGGRQAIDPVLTQSIAQDAAMITAQQLDAEYHDELSLTLSALEAFVAAGGGSIIDLQASLSHLPLDVLQGKTGSVSIDDGAALLIHQGQTLIARYDKYEINKYYVMPLATGLRDGLRAALQPGAGVGQ